MGGSVGVHTKLAMCILHTAINNLHPPAIVKLSVLLAVLLRHITVVSFLVNILDAVTCSVEVKFSPLTLMRVAVKRPRSKILGGVLPTKYAVVWVMSGLRHSRDKDPNTRQVNVTRSPEHVNWLSLFDVSTTFSIQKERWQRGENLEVFVLVYMEMTHPKHQKYINKPLETKLNTLNNQLQWSTGFPGSEIPLLLYQWESDDCK